MCRVLDSLNSSQLVERDFAFCLQRTRHQLFADKNSIHFPLPDNDSLNEQVFFFFPLLFFSSSCRACLPYSVHNHTPALFFQPSSANLAFQFFTLTTRLYVALAKHQNHLCIILFCIHSFIYFKHASTHTCKHETNNHTFQT